MEKHLLYSNHRPRARNYLANFPKSFYDCLIEARTNFEETYKVMTNMGFQKVPYMMKSPCLEKGNFKNCTTYCQWSKDHKWPNIFSRQEFLTLMKFALPQGKLVMDQNLSEFNLSKKLLGIENMKNKPMYSPVPLVIFCKYQEHQPWSGRDIGWSVKVCDDFEQVPSQVGLCLSSGMDHSKIFKNADFFSRQKSIKIKGGTKSGVATFILDTHVGQTSQTFERTLDTNFDFVLMEIHPTNTMAQILHGESQAHNTRSFTLEKGYEYTFEVTIEGQMITKNFEKLPFDQKKCKHQTENEDNSWFKHYSQQNCKYECKAKTASGHCGCLPWDFYHLGKFPECDVFGRTCFLNVMKNMTEYFDSPCENDCPDDCLYLRYMHKLKEKINFSHLSYKGHFKRLEKVNAYSHEWKECTRSRKALCDYLLDKNNTFESELRPEINIEEQNKGLIIINIVFPLPTVDVVVMDARYTLVDKISSLGGSFGLFTQFTGCSIIAMIHLTILTLKRFHALIKDLKKRLMEKIQIDQASSNLQDSQV